MTDIVERLRVFATQRYDDRLVTEAADEIERLKHGIERHLTICTDQQDEIERLRAENEWRRSAAKAWELIAQTNQELCDEIEQLRAALIELNETVEDYADADDGQPNLAMRIMVMVRTAIEKSPPAPCHRKDWTG